MARKLQPCGTVAAFARHRNRGEEPCQPCRDAYNTYSRTSPRNRAYQRARQRALSHLAHVYATAYEAMFADELAKAYAEEEAKGGT